MGFSPFLLFSCFPPAPPPVEQDALLYPSPPSGVFCFAVTAFPNYLTSDPARQHESGRLLHRCARVHAVTHRVRGCRCERDARDAPEMLLPEGAQFQIGRAEVVPPSAHAVALVHGQEAHQPPAARQQRR